MYNDGRGRQATERQSSRITRHTKSIKKNPPTRYWKPASGDKTKCYKYKFTVRIYMVFGSKQHGVVVIS